MITSMFVRFWVTIKNFFFTLEGRMSLTGSQSSRSNGEPTRPAEINLSFLPASLGYTALPLRNMIALYSFDEDAAIHAGLRWIRAAQIQFFTCAWIDLSSCLKHIETDQLFVNRDELLYSQANSFQEACRLLLAMVKKSLIDVIVLCFPWDSFIEGEAFSQRKNDLNQIRWYSYVSGCMIILIPLFFRHQALGMSSLRFYTDLQFQI